MPSSETYGSDTPIEPLSFIDESGAASNLLERGIASKHVESDAPLQLSQADGTKMQRSAVTFGQMIGAIHQAVKIRAVSEAKHMAGFVRKHLATSSEEKRLVNRRSWFAIECRIVAGETINTRAFSQGSLSENEIPGGLRI